MADFNQVLDASNAELIQSLSARGQLVPHTPNLPPEYSGLPGYQAFDPTTGYGQATTFLERSIAADNASRRYRAVMAQQQQRDLAVAAGRGAAGVIGGALLSGIPVVGSIAGYMGGGWIYDQIAKAAGWSDPMQVYSRDDWVRSQIATSMDATSNRFLNAYQFGTNTGLNMDQSQALGGRMMSHMRGMGYQGLEVTRMMPIFAESGLLDPSGKFKTLEDAFESLAQNLERLTERATNTSRRLNIAVEEAAAFVVREEQMAGRRLSVNDTRYMDALSAGSGFTGMSLDQTHQFMTQTMGPWRGTPFDLIPLAQAASIGLGVGQLTSSSSPWGTAWDRAGGVEAVVGGYAAAGNQYWMQKTQMGQLGRMWSAGALTNESMYELAAGGKFSAMNLPTISNTNDRYEAMYFGMEAMARDPLAAQSAAFGDVVRRMEAAGVHSREARAVWLTQNEGMDLNRALATLDYHEEVTSPEARFGAWVGTVNMQRADEISRVDTAVGRAFSDAGMLSNLRVRRNAYTAALGAYGRSDMLGENVLNDIRENLSETLGTGRRHLDRLDNDVEHVTLQALRTTLGTQLRSSGIGMGDTAIDLAIMSGLGDITYEDFIRDDFETHQAGNAWGRTSLNNVLGYGIETNIVRPAGSFYNGSDRGSIEAANRAYQEDLSVERHRLWSAASPEQRLEWVGSDRMNNISLPSRILDIVGAGTVEAIQASRSSRYATQEQMAALERYYGGGTQRHTQAAVQAIISSGNGGSYFGNVDISGDTIRAAGDLNAMTNAYTALSGVEETPVGMYRNRGTAESYRGFVSSLETSDFNMVEFMANNNSGDYQSHMSLRQGLASAGFGGKSWDQLSSSEQAVVNEFITNNDESGNWGGRQTDLLQGLAKQMGEQAEAFEVAAAGEMTGAEEIIYKRATSLISGTELEKLANRAGISSDSWIGRRMGIENREFGDLTQEDIDAYYTARAARAEGNTEEANAIYESLGSETLTRLDQFDIALGSDLGAAGTEALFMRKAFTRTIAGTMGGLDLDNTQQNELVQAFLANDTAEASRILNGSGAGTAWGDWASGEIDRDEFYAQSGAKLPGADPAVAEEGRVLSEVASNLERGIQTVRLLDDAVINTNINNLRELINVVKNE